MHTHTSSYNDFSLGSNCCHVYEASVISALEDLPSSLQANQYSRRKLKYADFVIRTGISMI